MQTLTNDTELDSLARQVADLLHVRHLRLTTAESCTGGWVAKVLTDIPGSSSWFERGFVTYSNQSKQDMLGVPADVLQQHGAVSEAVAGAMAEGALSNSRADLSLAITGIAGPGGGSDTKPVGLVCFAWAGKDAPAGCETQNFAGDRDRIRRFAVMYSLQGLMIRVNEL